MTFSQDRWPAEFEKWVTAYPEHLTTNELKIAWAAFQAASAPHSMVSEPLALEVLLAEAYPTNYDKYDRQVAALQRACIKGWAAALNWAFGPGSR